MITCIYIDLEQSRFKLSCNVVREWNSISEAIRSWCMECKKHELETTEDRTKFGILLSQQGSLSMRMLVFCSRTDLGSEVWSARYIFAIVNRQGNTRVNENTKNSL